MPTRIVYSVSEKSTEIIDELIKKGEMRFSALIAESKSRTEMVATFIALLELCREGRVSIMGEGEDVTISKLSEEGGGEDGNEGA